MPTLQYNICRHTVFRKPLGQSLGNTGNLYRPYQNSHTPPEMRLEQENIEITFCELV